MLRLGNDAVNNIFEASVAVDLAPFKIQKDSSRSDRDLWITEKYVKRSFVKKDDQLDADALNQVTLSNPFFFFYHDALRLHHLNILFILSRHFGMLLHSQIYQKLCSIWHREQRWTTSILTTNCRQLCIKQSKQTTKWSLNFCYNGLQTLTRLMAMVGLPCTTQQHRIMFV